MGFRPLLCGLGGLDIAHIGVLANINALDIVTEFNGDAVGIESIDGMDKTVVDDLRNMESSRRELILEVPKIFLRFDPKRDVVKYKGPADRSAMVFV